MIEKSFEVTREEFERVFIQAPVPKLQKARKNQDPQAFDYQFMEALQKYNLVRPVSDQFGRVWATFQEDAFFLKQEFRTIMSLYEAMVTFFEDARSQLNGRLIVLETGYNVIQQLNTIASKFCANLFLNQNKDQESLHLGKAIFKFFIFLQNECYILNGRKLSTPDLIVELGDMCMHISKILMIHLDQADESGKYISWFKKLIDHYSSVGAIYHKSLHLIFYYCLKIKLEIHEDNLQQTVIYGLKAAYQHELSFEKSAVPCNAFVSVCRKLMMQFFIKNRLKEGLIWANLALNATLNFEQFQNKVCAGLIDFPVVPPKENIQNGQKDIAYLKIVISQKKGQLFEINTNLIKDIFKTKNKIINIKLPVDKSNQFKYLDIAFEEDIHLKLLNKQLHAFNIFSSFDNQIIRIYGIVNMDLDAFSMAIDKWQVGVNRINELKTIEEKMTGQSPIQVEPVSYSPSNQIAESNLERFVPKIKTDQERASNLTTQTAFPGKTNTIIGWGSDFPAYDKNQKDNKVYKLIGSTAVRQFLFIKPELHAALLKINPLAAKNLVNICERRKAISKSQGNKGALIVNGKAELKDCTKDYRFFGQTAARTTQNGKTYELVIIDQYKESHGSKAPVRF